ncbi:HNH endonuclease signature motif containing protein [Mangrovicoccus ximenensis]|uniref:HNH endonuclease signature motif containing protein n=1 Tax=Mangrovicoccus ximenensis TaxID=1911570 RepID=UPI000D383DD4|nr:HNH endonuclease signature motif containing protein [Mangrovicoccus ximenensis]
MPKLICVTSGCEELAQDGCARCAGHEARRLAGKSAAKNRRSDAERQWRKLYSRAWRKASAAFLAKHPTCRDCAGLGLVTAATEVDHIVPHRGDRALFWDRRNWQPLCKPCHSRKTAAEVWHGAGAPGVGQESGVPADDRRSPSLSARGNLEKKAQGERT